jgi:hypothetical protein
MKRDHRSKLIAARKAMVEAYHLLGNQSVCSNLEEPIDRQLATEAFHQLDVAITNINIIFGQEDWA